MPCFVKMLHLLQDCFTQILQIHSKDFSRVKISNWVLVKSVHVKWSHLWQLSQEMQSLFSGTLFLQDGQLYGISSVRGAVGRGRGRGSQKLLGNELAQ